MWSIFSLIGLPSLWCGGIINWEYILTDDRFVVSLTWYGDP